MLKHVTTEEQWFKSTYHKIWMTNSEVSLYWDGNRQVYGAWNIKKVILSGNNECDGLKGMMQGRQETQVMFYTNEIPVWFLCFWSKIP